MTPLTSKTGSIALRELRVMRNFASCAGGSGQCRLERNDEYGMYVKFEDYERLLAQLAAQTPCTEYIQHGFTSVTCARCGLHSDEHTAGPADGFTCKCGHHDRYHFDDGSGFVRCRSVAGCECKRSSHSAAEKP